MKTIMPYLLAALISILTWVALYHIGDLAWFDVIYEQKLQTSFFTAFLTVGSFLLAMKAFMLTRLRDDVYDNERYKRTFIMLNCRRNGQKYYQGLIELGNLLALSVVASFITSISQITLGLCAIEKIRLIAPAMAAGTLSLLLIDCYFVYRNLQRWLEYIEEDKMEALS